MNEMPSKSAELIRVVILEDCPVVREGLAHCLAQQGGIEVCGHTDAPDEARGLIARAHGCVLLMDVMHDGEDGVEFARAVIAEHPDVRVLVFSLQDEGVYAERMLRAGAMGYVTKRAPVAEIVLAIRTVAAGGIYVSPRLSLILLGRLLHPAAKHEGKNGIGSLTARELYVFQLLGAGFGVREIGTRLGVSTKTVQAHRENMKNKLGFATAGELTRHATLWLREHGGSVLRRSKT